MTANGNRGDDFDLVVIGTGAAGMAAAIRGAELGPRVAIVETATIGGTCVNVGCIPSKNLLAAAERYHAARAGFPGIPGCEPGVDWQRLRTQKRELIESLRQSKYLDVLASYRGLTPLRGRARLSPNEGVEVDGALQRMRRCGADRAAARDLAHALDGRRPRGARDRGRHRRGRQRSRERQA